MFYPFPSHYPTSIVTLILVSAQRAEREFKGLNEPKFGGLDNFESIVTETRQPDSVAAAVATAALSSLSPFSFQTHVSVLYAKKRVTILLTPVRFLLFLLLLLLLLLLLSSL